MRLKIRMLALLACLSVLSLQGCATTRANKPVKNTENQRYLNQGNQYARDGLYREAIAEYKKALSDPRKENAARRNMGMVYVKMGEFAKAENMLQKVIKKYQNNFECNFYLGEALRAQDKFADAIYHYQKADRLKRNAIKNLKSLAWSYFKIRYYSEALAVIRRVVKIKPNDEQSNIILARTLLKLKRPKKALAVVRRSIKKVGKNTMPYFRSVEGDILFEMGRVSQATASYKKAIKARPLLAGSLLGLGKCLLDKGKHKESIKYMERAARVRPQMAQTQYFLAKAYEGINKKKSIMHYKKFGRLAATDPEFLSKISEVRSRISFLKN